MSAAAAFDPLAAKAAQATAAPAANSGYDPLALVAAGKALPTAASTPSASPSSPNASTGDPTALETPINGFVQGFARQNIQGTAGAVGGGLEGLWDLALGRGSDVAAQDVQHVEQESAYRPQDAAQRAGAEAASSDWNPLNWPGVVAGKVGQWLGHGTEALGAGPLVSTMAQVAPDAALAATGLRAAGALKLPEVGEAAALRRTAAVEGDAATSASTVSPASPPTDGAPVDGGLPKSAIGPRDEILKRVGITQARDSATSGDAKAAATDYQMTHFDEPGGRAMAAQFDHERNTLAGFTERLISDVGGSKGMDEDALINRGSTIARPFDDLREWFDARQKQLYSEAQARSDELAAHGNPMAYTQLQGVDALLKSPDFANTLMARDQGNLLNAVRSQLERFRATNPAGFTPAGAEQFRQWLNQIWSPSNRWAIGQLKGALDQDVTSTAGEDLYAQARAIHALKARTLEDPKGIAQLFDANPMTPINRVTPFEKIPDKVTALSADQFANLMQTLREMPPELQPEAQEALGEIKGQLLNRILKAGTETRTGRGAQVWRGEDVSQVLARHAAKFRIAFDGDPQVQAKIKDLNAAGQILRTDQSYPGAYAQAANMAKRGLGSGIVRQIGRVGGATVGAVGGPLGAAAGEMVGAAAGERAASGLSERAALKTVRERLHSLEGN